MSFAALLAAVVGLLTWEVVALSLSATALATAAVAIVLAREAFARTEQFQVTQSERITALEPPPAAASED